MTDPTSTSPDAPRPVLLVEDDLDQAHLIRFLLEDDGEYQVTLAQDGVRGSRLARERSWAVVITDLNLPGALGFDVLEASREAHPDTPVLATTGFTESDYLRDARSKGAAAVLLKPLDRDELLEQVRRLVQPEPPPTPPEAEDTTAPPAAGGHAAVSLIVLAVGIRPGELEAGCGGTILRHLGRGDQVALLVLGQGNPSAADRAKAAARQIGARFFVGSSNLSDETAFEADAADLLTRAIRDVRPDVLYLPTPNRHDPLGAVLHGFALKPATDVPRVFCFDPGDPSPAFRPDLFVRIDRSIERKVEMARLFEGSAGSRLDPDEIAAAARFWGRFAGGAAEPLEVLRGTAPWEGAGDPEPAAGPEGTGDAGRSTEPGGRAREERESDSRRRPGPGPASWPEGTNGPEGAGPRELRDPT